MNDRKLSNQMMAERIASAPAQILEDGNYALRVLQSKGRKTGMRRTTPIGVFLLDERLYLVSPRKDRDWCLNLLACPDLELFAGGQKLGFTANPVNGREGLEVAKGYFARLSWQREQFPFHSESSDDEILCALEGMLIFRLE